MPHDDAAPKSSDHIPTNLRLLMLLEAVVNNGGTVKPAQIGKVLGLPKPTIHRLLKTAEDAGFLRRDMDGRSYGPGVRLRRLATHTLSASHIQRTRSAILRNLSQTVGETCNLAAPADDGMIYLDRHETAWPLRIQLPTGSTVPFHCTASGKLYLASLPSVHVDHAVGINGLKKYTTATFTDITLLKSELSKIYRQGYATDNEEFMIGMVALGVPIKDLNGRLLSTISIHAPIQRMTLDQMMQHLPKLQQASEQMTSLITMDDVS
ncbi:MAG: IclR family transcriptional regulator [Pseudomonadota bacterium]